MLILAVAIQEEEHCMLLLCSLLDSLEHLVMAIGSTTTQFKMDTVVSSSLSKEMRKKYSKTTKEALSI